MCIDAWVLPLYEACKHLDWPSSQELGIVSIVAAYCFTIWKQITLCYWGRPHNLVGLHPLQFCKRSSIYILNKAAAWSHQAMVLHFSP